MNEDIYHSFPQVQKLSAPLCESTDRGNPST